MIPVRPIAPAWLVAAALLATTGAPSRAAQELVDELPPLAEGPLANDVLLPADPALEAALRRGDEALAEAVAANDPERADRALGRAFEAWREGIEAAGPGASVRLDPPGGSEPRTTLGATQALWLRLGWLTPEARSSWAERFEATSEARLADLRAAIGGRAGASSPPIPGTLAEARAELLLGDREYEAGHPGRAGLRWARARRTLQWLEPTGLAGTTEARSALVSRERVLASSSETPAASSVLPPELETATGLRAVTGIVLSPGAEDRISPRSRAGVWPGLCVLSETDEPLLRIAVQTAERVHLFSIGRDGRIERGTSFVPEELLPGFGVGLDPRTARRPPGWPLVPVARDGTLYLVVGRALEEEDANALVAARPSPSTGLSVLGGGTDARLAWALVGDRHVDAAGNVTELAPLAAYGTLELQPGPVLVADTLCVQARAVGAEVRALLLGLAPEDGRLLWVRELVTGSDLGVEGLGRSSLRVPRSGAPLLATAGRVAVPTNLGALALLDPLDGAPLYTFETRRRAPGQLGWAGRAPIEIEGGLLLAPFDSDRAYCLAVPAPGAPVVIPPAAGPPYPMRAAPLPIGESRVLLGGDAQRVIVLGRAGRESTVSELSLVDGGRRDAIYLGPDEKFQGRGLVGRDRVLVTTDRALYLFDRTRELFLLDVTPLPRTGSSEPGGDLVAAGGVLLCLGRDSLSTFLPR